MSRRVDYAALTERKCSQCGLTKTIDQFGQYVDASAPLTGWRYYSRCRDCNKMQCRSYGAKSKPKRNARLRTWRAKNPQKARALDRRKRLAKYGLTEEKLEAMIRAQNACCFLCKRKDRLVIDHCHVTGDIRRLLCIPCNNVVGWIENNKGMNARLIEYLDPCHADVLLEIANAETP